MTKTKRIEWSYPTSPNADKFGFKRGCWCVEIVTAYMPRAIAGFGTWQEAKDHAEKLSLPWDSFGRNESPGWPPLEENPNASVKQVFPEGRWS